MSTNSKTIWTVRRFANLRVACRCLEKQGATTAVESGSLAVVQENHLDPWGLTLPVNATTDNVAGSPTDRFKFTDKELQAETGWYDFGARMYDPAGVRWTTIDPMAEKYYNLSVYNYVANNPVLYIDPDGRDVELNQAGETTNKKTGVTTITYNINVSMAIMNSTGMGSKKFGDVVSTFINQLTKALSGTFNAGDKTKIVFQAGKIDIRSVSDMSEVKKTDHLMVIVDNVTGKSAKGGEAGGLAEMGGKIAYVENGSTPVNRSL
jgi:RHS repeat-associated protein